jgi:cephalosporin-C deacetylase
MVTTTAHATDIAAYWDDVDRELAQLPVAPTLDHLPLRSTEFCTVYALRLTSVGPARIFGYLSVPAAPGPHPGLFITPRYGSVNHVPPYADRQRYTVLVLMHRGQRLADEPFAASYPGLFTLGIEDPQQYVFRGIVADCLRGAEFLASHPSVDTRRMAVTGGDLAVFTAARRPVFKALVASGFLHYRLLETCARTTAYPLEEINDWLRLHPASREAVARTAQLFDPVHQASGVNAHTLLPVGAAGTTTGSDWLAPLSTALRGPVSTYEVTHRGAVDHRYIDSWTAQQLAAEP